MPLATEVLDVLSLAYALFSSGRCRGPYAVRPLREGEERPNSLLDRNNPLFRPQAQHLSASYPSDPRAIGWCAVGALIGACCMLGYSEDVETEADLLCKQVVMERSRAGGDRPMVFSHLNDHWPSTDEEVASVYCDAAAKINPK
jgi:hypothetical protein